MAEEAAVATSEETQVATVPVSIIGNDGNFVEGWKNSLPEDIRSETCLGTCSNVESMARQYINAQKMIGKDKILRPGENSTEEDWAAYHVAGGRPDTAGDYNFKAPEGFPEGLFNDGLAKKAQELFFKEGLSRKQADAVFAFHNQNVLDAAKGLEQVTEQHRVEAADALHSKWGNAYEQRLHYGKVAIKEGTNGDIDFEKRLTDTLGNNTDFIELVANLGAKFSEHGMTAAPQIATPGDLQTQIDEIMATPEYRGGPGIPKGLHDTAIKKVAMLFEEKAKSEQRAG